MPTRPHPTVRPRALALLGLLTALTLTLGVLTATGGQARAAGSRCVAHRMGIPPAGTTYLGAAVSGTSDLGTRESQFGRTLALHRTYFQASQIKQAARTARADLAAGRLPWISFKAPHSWAAMATGAGDAWSRQVADALKKVPGPVWMAVHHEPENDGDMRLWTRMQRQIAPIIHQRTNNVAYSVIYSGWNTFGGGNNTVARKWPGDRNVDILAIDAYNDFGAVRDGREGTKSLDLRPYYRKMARWSRNHGTAWAIGETGQTRKGASVDPTWLDRAYHQMVRRGGAGLSYYDSSENSVADWTLNDSVKRARFKGLLPGSARVC
ncbi:MAG TPA: cellulase family glycosylhydrolase [Nocardioides sp.]|uniref:cellulase family glycosylhydrolase n=1 Tax=Nocardioides sp. TaxID=35761 RepID=UPI002BDB9EAF|nr:cellulase family glycosylhydrolase [Nocardioides sp.]HQR28331.1 cellulase family glycosylhydrolase [Nocardioides sp.]